MPCLNAEEALTNAKPLKVGLVGCGGRGLGAMKNALDADPGTIAWALADVFQERIDFGAKLLAEQYGNRAGWTGAAYSAAWTVTRDCCKRILT